jgi:hypothetical protein
MQLDLLFPLIGPGVQLLSTPTKPLRGRCRHWHRGYSLGQGCPSLCQSQAILLLDHLPSGPIFRLTEADNEQVS